MPRGIPKHKEAAVLAEQKAAEAARAAEKLRAELAAIPDKDELVETVEEMIEQERKILDNERINIIVEYACLGKEPKPEKYVGRPRYIKASRHGRTRLAKRSARRDDIPPPEEKMLVYDDEVARLLHAAKYGCLRKPGQEEKPPAAKDDPMEEDEQKEHSRDSGCPVSPTDKNGNGSDKKEGSGSSRGSVEKESRKRRSPDLLAADEAANSTSGTSHFIVKGNTPLTIIHKLLERKRLVHQDLRLELINANGKEILDEKQMNMTVAMLANERKWTRSGPLRILYTITRFTESEDLPVLDVQARCDTTPQQQSPAAAAIAAAAAAAVQTTPSPQQLQQMHQMHMQRMQHMQHMQQLQQQQQRMQQQQGQQMAVIITEDGQQHMIPYAQLQMMHHGDQEGLLKMSPPVGMQSPPPHHTSPQFLAPPRFGMGGARSPPAPGQQQQQMTSSSIFPPSGHVLVDNGNGSHLVAANVSVESVISNPASVKKRQRMAPKRTRERDELMARKGIEKGTTLVGKGGKMGLPMPLGNLPGITSIRMPLGCNPSNAKADLPIDAITIDGCTLPTTFRELPALSKAVAARIAAKEAAAAAAAAAAASSSMLTPEERMAETIDTVRSKAAAMHEHLQAERRASDASDASGGDAAEAADAAPVLAREESGDAEDQTPEELTPPPVLEAPDTPDSHRSLEIDEMMGAAEPPIVPQSMKVIPA